LDPLWRGAARISTAAILLRSRVLFGTNELVVFLFNLERDAEDV
jgi:hypothetical protein